MWCKWGCEDIKNEIKKLKSQGYNPYFIPNGGYGNLGLMLM